MEKPEQIITTALVTKCPRCGSLPVERSQMFVKSIGCARCDTFFFITDLQSNGREIAARDWIDMCREATDGEA